MDRGFGSGLSPLFCPLAGGRRHDRPGNRRELPHRHSAGAYRLASSGPPGVHRRADRSPPLPPGPHMDFWRADGPRRRPAAAPIPPGSYGPMVLAFGDFLRGRGSGFQPPQIQQEVKFSSWTPFQMPRLFPKLKRRSSPRLPIQVEEVRGVIGRVVVVAPAIRKVVAEAPGVHPTPTASEPNPKAGGSQLHIRDGP